MNTSNKLHTNTKGFNNLIGQPEHRQFISVLSAYGVAHRGGIAFPPYEEKHHQRLVSDINLLSPREHRQLIFSESIFSN